MPCVVLSPLCHRGVFGVVPLSPVPPEPSRRLRARESEAQGEISPRVEPRMEVTDEDLDPGNTSTLTSEETELKG